MPIAQSVQELARKAVTFAPPAFKGYGSTREDWASTSRRWTAGGSCPPSC